MSEGSPYGRAQMFRSFMWIPGLILLWLWSRAHAPLQHLERSIPPELIAPRQYEEVARELHELEEIFLHGAIICFTLGFEAVLIGMTVVSDWFISWRINGLFKRKPRWKRPPSQKWQLITADIDACVTPNLRAVVDLREVHKLRQYCEYRQANKEYPPLILISARAQEYTELLCQTLHLIDDDTDVPCVLENGMALYYPAKRTVKVLITEQQRQAMDKARDVLAAKLRTEYEFEPKDFMITINVDKQREEHQKADDFVKARQDAVVKLRQRVVDELKSGNLTLDDYDITYTDNAVDIVTARVNKFTGLQKLMEESGHTDVAKVVSIGNSNADAVVLKNVGEAFCSLDAMPAIQTLIRTKNSKNLIEKHDTAAVVEMLQRVTGLRFN